MCCTSMHTYTYAHTTMYFFYLLHGCTVPHRQFVLWMSHHLYTRQWYIPSDRGSESNVQADFGVTPFIHSLSECLDIPAKHSGISENILENRGVSRYPGKMLWTPGFWGYVAHRLQKTEKNTYHSACATRAKRSEDYMLVAAELRR